MRPAAVLAAARSAGLEAVVLLEHVPQVIVGEPADAWYSRRDNRSHLESLYEEVRRTDAAGVAVVAGAELDADPVRHDGRLMLADVSGIGWPVLATHYFPGTRMFWTQLPLAPEPLRKEWLTAYLEAISRALENNRLLAWAHPCDMLALAELLPDFTSGNLQPLEPVFAAMAEREVAFELNELLAEKLPATYLHTYPGLVETARAWGIRFVVGSDAHQLARIGARKWIRQVASAASLHEDDFVTLDELKTLQSIW